MHTTQQLTFAERLYSQGFVTYTEFLVSTTWSNTKQRYVNAGMPLECLICGRADYNLHHRSYGRIGEELVTDLVALCEPHHYEVHRLLKKGRPGVTLLNAHLYYRKEQFERRARQPRRLGEILIHYDIASAK